MAMASCPECGAETKYDLLTCTIHMYKQTQCNHIALVCMNPKTPHPFLLFFSMEWLAEIKQTLGNQRLDILPHGDAPEDLLILAKTALRRQPMFDSFNQEMDFFGETGIMFG